MKENAETYMALPDFDQHVDIRNMIFLIRNKHIMIDHDIAGCFGVETKRLNEQVKRNSDRFPESFCFRLNVNEKDELVANCDRLNTLKHSSVLPFAFTEQGLAMLSAVIKSPAAISASIYIMNAFVNLRKFMLRHSSIFERLGELEMKQIKTENKVNSILRALDRNQHLPQQGIFFDGQVFDACIFTINLVGSAKRSIILIDNYVDEQVLSILSKKNAGVTVKIYTSILSDHFQLSVRRFNEQYGGLEVRTFRRSHDRFLIIDEKEIYHIGASLKDLGKKWFAFTKLHLDPGLILERL